MLYFIPNQREFGQTSVSRSIFNISFMLFGAIRTLCFSDRPIDLKNSNFNAIEVLQGVKNQISLKKKQKNLDFKVEFGRKVSESSAVFSTELYF